MAHGCLPVRHKPERPITESHSDVLAPTGREPVTFHAVAEHN